MDHKTKRNTWNYETFRKRKEKYLLTWIICQFLDRINKPNLLMK